MRTVRHLAAGSISMGLALSCASGGQEVREGGSPVPAAGASTAGDLVQGSGQGAAAPGEARPARWAAEEVVEELFGTQVRDPWRWLEDVSRPDVRDWMAERDRRARQHLAALPGREALAGRLRELLYVEARTPPVVRGSRFFSSRRAKEAEKAVVYWQDGREGAPVVLLDPHAMSSDGSVSLGGYYPSWNGELVAYLVKANNADESTLHVREVATGRELPDRIEHLRYTDPSWAADGSGFYYTWIPSDPAIPANERMGYGEIRFHRLGTDPATDVVVREKTGDPTRWMSARATRDGKYLLLRISRGWGESSLYLRPLPAGGAVERADAAEWKVIAEGRGAIYEVEVLGDRLFVLTNEGAPRWRVFSVDPRRLDRKHWREVLEEDPTGVIDDVSVAGGHLVVTYLRDASSHLQIHKPDGRLVRTVPLPTLGTITSLSGREDLDEAYFSFSSFLYPEEIYATSIASGRTSVLNRVQVPIDASAFTLEQVWFPSKDGTKVSMFILAAKGLVKNGESPAFLYGYGGFNISQTPRFSPTIYPWLERGGVYALVNLRGGGEYGEAWHQAGMLERKQNVFDDFIAAGEHLVQAGYTQRGRIGAGGRSNGGLLVGAAMTQRPDLFRAIICGVPLLDMIRYTRVGIGKAWVPEYGDPDRAEHFPFLYAYSPYHNLRPGTEYPALLLTSADSDDRVDPMHARKFMAALEVASAGDRVKLLRIEQNSGHGGGDLRKKVVDLAADEAAFLLSELARAE